MRAVHVHLLPELIPAGALSGGTAVVIDVLRATTTMITALAAGCTDIRPCGTIDEARSVAASLKGARVILGGERGGVKIDGFDRGNSPLEYTAEVCSGAVLVMTTTNGTKALLRAAEAERVLIAGFVNFGAVCEHLGKDSRPVHIICAGTDGEVTVEDVLLAGALAGYLDGQTKVRLNDSARLAMDAFDRQRPDLAAALRLSAGGRNLLELGYDRDVEFAAHVDRFRLTPEVRREPLRIE